MGRIKEGEGYPYSGGQVTELEYPVGSILELVIDIGGQRPQGTTNQWGWHDNRRLPNANIPATLPCPGHHRLGRV